MLCAVSFNRYGRLYYLDPGELRPQVGDKVLVPTDDGPEVAECVWAAQWVTEETDGFPRLVGLAGDDDLSRDEALRRRKAEAKVAAKRLIRAHGLPMKVVAVDHVLASADGGGERSTVYFTAPHRVDFRSLVRDLGATLHCRVELRQTQRPGLRPRPGRHRLVWARSVLRHVPQRLRAGDHPDGKGPGPAAEPAAHLGRVWPADVLSQVRAPFVLQISGVRPGDRRPRHHPGRGGPRGRPQRPERRGERSPGRRRLALHVLPRGRLRLPPRLRRP